MLLSLCDPDSKAGLKCDVSPAPSTPTELKPDQRPGGTRLRFSLPQRLSELPGHQWMLKCWEQLCKGKVMLKEERKGILLGCWQEKQLNKGKKKKKLGNNSPPPTAPSHHPYACHLHSFRAPLPLQRNARALRKAEQGITQSGCPTVSPPGSRGPVVLWGHPKCHCRGNLASFAAGCGAEAAFFYLPRQ